MAENQTVDKTMITRVLVNRLEDDGKPNEIKAKHVQEFENPDEIIGEGKKERIIPDLVAVYDNETHIYQIQLDKNMHVDSWKILSLYAKQHNGNLYLVVPDLIKEKVKKEIVDNGINAGIIYFPTN